MARTKSKESTAANRNREKLGQDESFIELPEGAVRAGNDIPTEEDKEDKEDEEVEIVMGTEADVTKEDLVLLGDPDADNDLNEDELVANAKLDDIDDEGDPLNESGSDASGRDLDIPGGEDDEDGNADEENNFYSLGGDEKDDTDNGTPNEYRK